MTMPRPASASTLMRRIYHRSALTLASCVVKLRPAFPVGHLDNPRYPRHTGAPPDDHCSAESAVIRGHTAKAQRAFRRCVGAGVCLLMTSLPAHALRDDVLVIVNDNSVDSPQVGAYYAQLRGIDPANVVHVNVPNSYFISWDDFRRLRDQLIHFMQTRTLDDPGLTPAVCSDGDPPYYCQAAMDQLRTHTRIRYLVTTRGVPTRMTVDSSTLYTPNAPTSVDNYLKYWLLNYFADDVKLGFGERELAFGDGRGMRTVDPGTDRELIVGRIDGLDLDAAKALVDRAVATEKTGIYGTWYGSTQFWRWRDATTGASIYPRSGNILMGWRYVLGLWGEDRGECVDYLNFSGTLPEGKAPAHCRVQLNDNADVTLNTPYPAPGNPQSRAPQVIDALGYQGWLDGQAALGSFDALLNWRKNDQCTVTLCSNAADPAACRSNSSDILGELNTDCVGVADGFMGYNHSSFPLSYFTLWPTGWSAGNSGDRNRLAFPLVRTDSGVDNNDSLWVQNTDQVPAPRCYPDSDFTLPASSPCVDLRQLELRQAISLGDTPLDANNPPVYQVGLQYKTINIDRNTPLRVRLLVHETGAAHNTLIDYGFQTLATLTPGDTDWTAAVVQFPLDPQLHSAASYDRIELIFDTAVAFSGELGIDIVSVKALGNNVELAINGSFTDGHRQVATGDLAANFLNRFGGVAFWGSVGHHQSGGCAFCFNGLETLAYFMRGLPLGDAVWFNESNNSGILYGDPLYSPVAVRLNPVNSADTISSGTGTTPVDLVGSAVNGRDPIEVSTTYRVDICAGNDFYTCDQAQSWQSTGINGMGGAENALLGSLDTTLLSSGEHTLRLQVTSLQIASGRSQAIADYYVVNVNTAPVATGASVSTDVDGVATGVLSATDADGGSLSYAIVRNGSKGTAVITNAATGAYTYTANAGATGTDSFTFTASDGLADSNVATVTVQLMTIAVNTPPVATDASVSTDVDGVATGALSATDADGDSLSYAIVRNGSKGTAVITNAATGAYTYTANAGATGTDSFTFTASDGLADSNVATVTVQLMTIAVNTPPVATDASVSTDVDGVATGALSATDADGDSLSYAIVRNGSKGTAVITNAATGAYTYTANAGASGTDSFTFKANDGLADSNVATVTVQLMTPLNTAPVAADASSSTNVDGVATGVLSATDADGDGLSYAIVSNGSKGTAVVNNAATGAYTYTANAGATGADSFNFTANDGLTESNVATVTIQLTGMTSINVTASASETGGSGGSLNLFFIVLLLLLPGLRIAAINISSR